MPKNGVNFGIGAKDLGDNITAISAVQFLT